VADLTTLQDFFEYAQTHPAEAARFFVSSEFEMFLLSIDYTFMAAYEALHKDPVRERAMDNFFVLSGLKNKTEITIENKQLEFVCATGDTQMKHGCISITKSDDGYADTSVALKNNASWLTTHKPKTFSGEIHFTVDPTLVDGVYVREFVTIGSDPQNTVEITFRRTTGISLIADRDAYQLGEKGMLKVINRTGKDIKVEAFCPGNCIHFAARSYIVGVEANIPFDVKLSALLSAQMFFRKVPYIETSIEVKVTLPGQVVKKSIPLAVGEW